MTVSTNFDQIIRPNSLENDKLGTKVSTEKIGGRGNLTTQDLALHFIQNEDNKNPIPLVTPTPQNTQQIKNTLEKLTQLSEEDVESDKEDLLEVQTQYAVNSANESAADESFDIDSYIKEGEEIKKSLIADGENNLAADISVFMTLLTKLAQTMRNANRDLRTAEFQAQVQTLTQAADKILKSAQETKSAAKIQGWIQIAAGALQVGVAGYGGLKSYQGSKLTSSGESLIASANKNTGNPLSALDKISGSVDKAAGATASAIGNFAGGAAHAIGQTGGGVGSLLSMNATQAAADAHAEEAKLQALAKTHETAVQHSNEVMQQQGELINDIRAKFLAILQAELDANRSIIRS